VPVGSVTCWILPTKAHNTSMRNDCDAGGPPLGKREKGCNPVLLSANIMGNQVIY